MFPLKPKEQRRRLSEQKRSGRQGDGPKCKPVEPHFGRKYAGNREQRAALEDYLPNVWQQLAKVRGWRFDFQTCSVYIHTIEYSAAMKKKEIMWFVRKVDPTEETVLSKFSIRKTNTVCFPSFVVPRFHMNSYVCMYVCVFVCLWH